MSLQDNVNGKMRRMRSAARIEFLRQVPALTLLDRIPMPMIAVGLDDGALVYTNPASADLLGYADSAALNRQSLPTLMAEHARTRPRDCVTVLIDGGGAVTDWNHRDGFVVRTIVSPVRLGRFDHPVLLVGLTDATELAWTTGSPPTRPSPLPDQTTPPALIA